MPGRPEHVVTPQDTPPYFDPQRYERPCPQPDCRGRIEVQWVETDPLPHGDGRLLRIEAVCGVTACGMRDRYRPTITQADFRHLHDAWFGEKAEGGRFVVESRELATADGGES